MKKKIDTEQELQVSLTIYSRQPNKMTMTWPAANGES